MKDEVEKLLNESECFECDGHEDGINCMDKIKALFQKAQVEAVRADEFKDFQIEELTKQWDGLMTWMVKPPNDSLIDFMASHVSSFVYQERLASLKEDGETK